MKGQGGLQHVGMLITWAQTHTQTHTGSVKGWEKGYLWFIGVVCHGMHNMTFSSLREQ